MPNKDHHNEQGDNPQLSDDAIRDFVQTQKEQLEVRRQELDQQAREAEYNYEYSKQVLEAQERDRVSIRTNNQKILNKLFFFGGFLSIVLTVFLSYLVYSGNPNLVVEILKAIGYVLAGGAGGYGFGYKQAYTKQSEKD